MNDGDGNRIEKSSGKIYWYGAGTEILGESDTSGNITEEYVFFGGKRVAMRDVSSGNIYYYAADWLGTERARSNMSGAQCETITSLPFGDGMSTAGSCADVTPLHFTGKQRDGESGLDYFGARYNSSNIGRFMTPDWSATAEPVPYAQLGDPQTLNLYAYATDNPTTITDATGHAAGGSNPGPPPTISQDTSRNAEAAAGSVEACVLESTACAGAVNKPEAKQVTHKAKNAAEKAQAKQQRVPVVVSQTSASTPWGHVVIKVGQQPAVGLEPNSRVRSAGAVAYEVSHDGQPVAVSGHIEVSNSKAKDHVTLYVTKDQASRMQSYIKNASTHHQSYDFLYHNCATFVEDTLRAGGVNAPNDVTPHGLVEDLKKFGPP